MSPRDSETAGANVRQPKPLKRVQRLAIALGPALIRTLARTWRVRVINDAGWRARRERNEPILFTLWHGQLLPLVYQHRGEGVAVLISEHGDGEVITQIAEELGFRTVRGSSSRGAARALLGITRELEAGNDVAVTPDGPRGPAYKFAPGSLMAAHRSNVPIVTVCVSASAAWRMKSWDGFMIPKPFAALTVAYGDPEYVIADDMRAIPDQVAKFERLMEETEAAATAAAKAIGMDATNASTAR